MDSTEKTVKGRDFNTEVIWDNNRNLFDEYFKEEMLKNAHKLVYNNFSVQDPFDYILNYMKLFK